MKYSDLEVVKSKRYGDFCELTLKGDLEPSLPGQFYMLKGDWGSSPLLPRPISILDENFERKEIKFLIKNLGEGSKKLVNLKNGEFLKGTGPLGNHFPFEDLKPSDEIILIGGGVGVPPLYYLLKFLSEKGFKTIFLEGARTKSELLLCKEINGLGGELHITTEDGSAGEKGLIINIAERFKKSVDYVFACGPYGMLKAVSEMFEKERAKCFVSLEERMACGLGLCFGCVIKTIDEKEPYKRVCKEGPVFD
ncbi:MAG: dihydroorotate dehydrogenase electron transfer subunit, partial [Acidobacteria bacterium]|nr:dihydroorotate dehydrogenase electron transfer subunit [Acidobacteriota bacterium]